MKKKLPGVFPGKVKKNSGNNKQVFYSDKDIENTEEKMIEERKFSKNVEKNVNQKISEILNSPSYVYKADVIIKLKDKTVNKRIVGRNNSYLITIENELIPIVDVVDIHLRQK